MVQGPDDTPSLRPETVNLANQLHCRANLHRTDILWGEIELSDKGAQDKSVSGFRRTKLSISKAVRRFKSHSPGARTESPKVRVARRRDGCKVEAFL